jgi:PIN domain nuclease of toxin-antitoxin system
MDLLLDTHALIWFLSGDKQMPAPIRSTIADTSHNCFVSIVSLWEIAIKTSLGKLELEGSFDQIAGLLIDNEIDILPISFQHIQNLLTIDLHHRDPFDRMIIAQAIVEQLHIVTRDQEFAKYPVSVLWS